MKKPRRKKALPKQAPDQTCLQRVGCTCDLCMPGYGFGYNVKTGEWEK